MRRRELLALPFTLQAQDPLILTGRPELPPAPLELQAGALTLLFEPALGFVRYLRFGEHEVLRGIYAAVRDENWGTVAPQVSNLQTVTSPHGFQLDFDVACRQGDIDFAWHGTVKGEASGALRFDFKGQARSTFQRNRIGFCVLHPLSECAGQPCTAEQANGALTQGRFPDFIAPHQPLLNLRAVSHRLPDGSEVEVRFAGDIFEMEDHRNWTDGNYKTYCTPLALPFPVEVKQGTRLEQSVIVKVKPKGAPARFRQRSYVELTSSPATGQLPAIGFGLPKGELILQGPRAALVAAVKPAHLRVDLVFDKLGQYRGLFDRAAMEARVTGTKLEVVLELGPQPEPELRAIAKQAADLKAPIARWLVFRAGQPSTPPEVVALARQILPGVVGSGTNQYFTELNRERPLLTSLDCVAYSLNPQVHAFDNVSLIENLSPQGDTVRSAKQFCGAKPIVVTPVTLKPRFNPQQRSPAADSRPPSDYRQPSLFAAAWTLGSVKYLSEAGAGSVTYYDTHGPTGLLTSESVFALYHVFADLAEFVGGSYQALDSNSPLEALGFAVRLGARRRTLVANLTAGPRIVRVPATGRISVRTLDDRTYAIATQQPLKFRRPVRTIVNPEATLDLALGPYALVTLDHGA